MDRLGQKLGLVDLDGWYNVTAGDILSLGAASVLNHHGNSLSRLLASVYPNHPWDVTRFPKRPQNYWTSIDHQKAFMNELGERIGIRDLDGWYACSNQKLITMGAGGILTLYNNSLSKLLAAVYPNHPWDVSRFSKRPQNYWTSYENQKQFMDELGKKVGIFSESDLEKWYEQSIELLEQNGGRALADLYHKNLPNLLSGVYPQYKWQLWKFRRQLRKVLQNEEELDKLFSHLELALGIQEPEDWYRVTTEQLSELKVPSFYRSQGGLADVLSKRYPNTTWDADAFFKRGYRRATQRWLSAILVDLFPEEIMLTDYYHRAGETATGFELDIFFPQLHLAFEYQGVQHYEQLPVYGTLGERVARDADKSAQCKAQGISLIEVPFWWNKKRPELLAALLAQRPDLFQSKLAPYLEEARRGSINNL